MRKKFLQTLLLALGGFIILFGPSNEGCQAVKFWAERDLYPDHGMAVQLKVVGRPKDGSQPWSYDLGRDIYAGGFLRLNVVPLEDLARWSGPNVARTDDLSLDIVMDYHMGGRRVMHDYSIPLDKPEMILGLNHSIAECLSVRGVVVCDLKLE